MKTTIDYRNSPAPNFDAVNDIKEYFGDKYDKIAAEMCKIINPDQFAIMCSFGGVEGFPVQAWYDHFHGQGSWEKETAKGKTGQ